MTMKKIWGFILVLMLLSAFLPQAYGAIDNPYEAIPATNYDMADNEAKFPKKSGYVAMNARNLVSYICFKDVEFTDAPYAVAINSATSSDYLKNNVFEIRLDDPKGEVMSTVYVTECATWGVPVENVGTIEKKITGRHDIYILTNQPNDFYTFEFRAIRKGQVAYKPYSEKNTFSDIDSDKFKNSIEEMAGLGITEAYKDNTYVPDLPVTRGLFAKWASRLMTAESPKANEQVFNDVPLDFDGADEITYLYKNGILKLNNEKTFDPWRFITVKEASVILLRILGYEPVCCYGDNSDFEYSRYASQLGFYKNAASADFLRRNVAAQMLKTAINAQYLEVGGIENGNINYDKKTGILNKTRNIDFATDIVTATVYSGLIGDINVPDGTCYIGTDKYYVNSLPAENYIGVRCKFYYEYNSEEDKKTLIYIAPASDVTEVILDTKAGIDFKLIGDEKISYTDINDKTYDKKINKRSSWIYNNRAMTKPVSDIKPADFCGRMRLIDNGNGIETVIVEQYINIKIESVDAKNNIFKDSLSQKIYNFSEKKLYLSDGEAIVSPKKIQRDQLCELYLSDDDEMAVILLGESVITAKADTINSDDTVEIDGKSYYKANELKEDIELGITYDFHLNRHGEIVYIKSNDDTKLIGILSNFKRENNKTVISLITKTNYEMKYEVTDKIYIDGVRLSEFEDIKNGYGSFKGLVNAGQNTPVLYRLNEENKICMLDTVLDGEKNDKDTLTAFNAYDSEVKYAYKSNMGVFRRAGTLEIPFPVDPLSTTIFVGKYSQNGDNCYIGKLNTFSSSEDIAFVFYSTARDSRIADIVYCPEFTNYKHDGFSVIDSMNECVNDEGRKGLSIKAYEGASKKSLFIPEENEEYINYAKALKKGDVVNFYTDIKGEVDEFTVGCFADGKPENSLKQKAGVSINNGAVGNPDLSGTYLFGKIKEIDGDYIRIEAFGSTKVFWCKISGISITRVKEDNLDTGLSVSALKTDDVVFIRFSYSVSNLTVFDTISQ